MKEFQVLSREDPSCCLLTSTLTVTVEVVLVVRRWHRMEEQPNLTLIDVENRLQTIIERTLTGKARMDAYKESVAETDETERVKERT